jgi:hypothetical protein
MLDHGFDGGTVMAHGVAPWFIVRHSGARVSANPESRSIISGFRVCAKRRIPE